MIRLGASSSALRKRTFEQETAISSKAQQIRFEKLLQAKNHWRDDTRLRSIIYVIHYKRLMSENDHSV